MILVGDCVEQMRTLDADSVDAVVTDPPYGLEFMGKEWDAFKAPGRDALRHARKMDVAPESERGNPWASERKSYGSVKKNPRCKRCGKLKFDHAPRKCQCESPDWDMRIPESMRPFQAWCEAWGREALRVTKPGGYLLAFGGTRTHHRLVCGLEDAGWIIRDELDWIYASGFPKGKANLKPAHEPIVLARKPGPLRPLAIDATRIPSTGGGGDRDGEESADRRYTEKGGTNLAPLPGQRGGDANGRWPSNVLLQDPELFDVANPGVVGSGAVTGSGERVVGGPPRSETWILAEGSRDRSEAVMNYGDNGGYSRFFRIPANTPTTTSAPSSETDESSTDAHDANGTYPNHFIVPKADRADREPVLRGQLEERPFGQSGGAQGAIARGEEYQGTDASTGLNRVKMRENSHPTVKPVDLMRHLIRLVTPVGGTVLDCFLGSGSTAIAAEMEGFAWLGIEKEPEYVAIAEARLNGVQRGLGLDVPAPVQTRITKPLEHRSVKEQQRLAKSNAERPIEDLYWTMKGRQPPEEAA